MINARGFIVVAVWCLALLTLAACGDDYTSYEAPADGAYESEWHRCMRTSAPIGRSAKCQDLR